MIYLVCTVERMNLFPFDYGNGFIVTVAKSRFIIIIITITISFSVEA